MAGSTTGEILKGLHQSGRDSLHEDAGILRVLRGTARPDRLIGTASADRLSGLEGDDTLQGGGGNDLLLGGTGSDTARFTGSLGARVNLALTRPQDTGSGFDTLRGVENLIGGSGPDLFTGDRGANVLHGKSGNDTLAGGSGNDTLSGGAGNDLYRGGSGADTVILGNAARKIDLRVTGAQKTGEGLDRFIGIENVTAGNKGVQINGNKAANRLTGGAGNDTISGFGGDDALAGAAGNDILDGGDGNDVLTGGSGDDVLRGGAGNDTADYGHMTAGIRLDLAAGTATGEGTDRLSGIENATGGSGADTLLGDDHANRLAGGGGNDRLEGRGGNDHLDAGLGDDILDGGSGDDVIDGGTGGDAIGGGAGNDQIRAGDGNDTVDGGTGDDVIDGGAGGDTVLFGSGSDRVSTGDGADTITVTAGAIGSLEILDFTTGQDVLDLSSQGTIGKVSAGGLSGSGTAEIAVVDLGGRTLLAIDRDGDGQAEVSITVNGPFDLYGDARANLPNRAPVAQDDQAATEQGSAITVDLLANDADPDGHALSVKIVAGPGHGTLTLNPDKTVTYTPAEGWSGTDAFTYRIDDGHGGVATATATIQVQPRDDQDGYTTHFHVEKTSGQSPGHGGRTFFIDPSSGGSGHDGLSEGSAWSSFDDIHRFADEVGFQPGDRILLKRGHSYDSTDGFWLKGNGTADQPIVLGAFGNGAPPVLTNSRYVPDAKGKDTSIHDAVLNVEQGSSHFVIRDLKIDNPGGASGVVTDAGIRVLGTHVTVDNVEIAQTGTGVWFGRNGASQTGASTESAHGLVQNCYIHDLTMVRNTSDTADDDYGCVGVAILASDVVVRQNTFTNLMSESFDYGYDGAAVELYGSVHNALVQGNYIENVNAVTEAGGRSVDTVSDVWFDHNIIVNSESLAAFHNGTGTYGLGSLHNVNFTNNTVCGEGNRADSSSFAFAFGGSDGSFLNVQNNIFAIQSIDYWDIGATNYRHSGNLYDDDLVGFRSDYFSAGGEYRGEAAFRDAAARDFHLTALSDALSRALPIDGFLRDYVGRDLTSRGNLDLGAIEYW